MEDVLSNFSTKNLDIKLTSEKMFINTLTSNEAFALRSVNGIGVIDLVDDFNKELTLWKSGTNKPKFVIGLGVLLVLSGFAQSASLDSSGAAPSIGMGIALAIAGYFWMTNKNSTKPVMMSAVRIMMSGGNRDFAFDKAGTNSNEVAEFVAKVESTLTAYRKSND